MLPTKHLAYIAVRSTSPPRPSSKSNPLGAACFYLQTGARPVCNHGKLADVSTFGSDAHSLSLSLTIPLPINPSTCIYYTVIYLSIYLSTYRLTCLYELGALMHPQLLSPCPPHTKDEHWKPTTPAALGFPPPTPS